MQRRSRPVSVKASLGIAADFRDRIARGELRAGDPLPVEIALVDQLGVSKWVVREALRILETEGLVELRRGLGGGPRVRHPSIPEAASGIGVYLKIGDVLVSDVWISRDRIIGRAVEGLAIERTNDDVVELERSVQQLTDLVGDFIAFFVQLLDVSEAVVRFAGNTTDHVLVVALRHVIAAELEAATRSVVDVDEARAVEEGIASAWRDISRNVKARRSKAARRAYDRQADFVSNALSAMLCGMTVGDVLVDGKRRRRTARPKGVPWSGARGRAHDRDL